MATVTATSAGQSVSIDYTISSALPVLPEVQFSSLSPVAGEHLGKTLARLSSPARVVMPAGTFAVIGDSDVNNYGIYAPKTLGLRGAGIGKTVAQLAANSYLNKSARPASAGSGVLRFGPNNSSTRQQTTLSDMTWIGTDQVGADGQPMFRAGLLNYYGQDAVWQDLKLVGMSRGGGNSPNTGETFAINSFHDINSRYLRIEVDGTDGAGNRIGGSPFGCNGSKNVYLEDCYFHDSLYSGLTFSYAGSVASPTDTITTLRTRVAMNANHPNIGSGSRFSGVNHEQVLGKITHTLLDVTLDQASLWDSNHVSIGADTGGPIPDNKSVLIDNPIWHGLSPSWANGAFVVKLWGIQVTPPAVKNADGSLKQPVIVTGTNPPAQNINPATQYAVSVGTGYVAP